MQLYGDCDFSCPGFCFAECREDGWGSVEEMKKLMQGMDREMSARFDFITILERQLAIDYDCTAEEVHCRNNIFRTFRVNEGARPVGSADIMLKIAVYREKLLVMARECLLEWCKEVFSDRNGIWLSEPENLIMLHNKLSEYGQKLADTHHHYIPAADGVSVGKRFEVKWYEREQIEIFRGDNRFWEALLFDSRTPDMLAVCAMDGEVILGMASVTRDCERMWQIGVNVTEEGRGKGVGSYVTSLLKEEVLRRGILPSYATVESHIKSQRVAFQAGFEPVFYELFSQSSM